MATTINPPGVQITTVPRTLSTSIRNPTLMAALIGPCIQLVDATTSAGEVNSDALAGTYNGVETAYSYPELINGAVVITTSVDVYLRYGNSNALTQLSASEYTATTNTLTIAAGANSIAGGSGVRVSVYISYEALRTEVTASPQVSGIAASRGIVIETLDDIDTYLGDIDIRNPLALAAYMAKVNAVNTSILCLGVHAVTAQDPDGTQLSYATALEALESRDVYTLVPLSQEIDVLSLFPTHVNSMSAVTRKSERICILCPEMPSTEADETQASGSYGSTVLAGTFETSGELDDVTAGDILNVTGSATEFTVQTISGSRVTVLPATLNLSWSDVGWSIVTEGAALSTKSDIADAYQAIGEGYNNRRVLIYVPDTVEIDVDGIIYELPGYYGACTAAAQIGEFKPQTPLTNQPIAGISSLDNSDDYFSPTNLDTMAAGGLFIVVQRDTSTLPVCRHQLTTAISAIETRELSIIKAIDYVAKSLRVALDPVIGNHVITTRFINTRVAPIVTGILNYLDEAGVIDNYRITSISQSTAAPDTILVDILISPSYPCNRIRIVLEV